MKQGSTDDPFADDIDDSEEEEADADPEFSQEEETTPSVPEERVRERSDVDSDSDVSSGGESGQLPYIYARDSVKDGRQQRPIFLRDEIEEGIPELVTKLEASLGKDVYRTDVLEAAVVIAQQNPDLVAEELEEWGYGWD
jgi:hypothetical protein